MGNCGKLREIVILYHSCAVAPPPPPKLPTNLLLQCYLRIGTCPAPLRAPTGLQGLQGLKWHASNGCCTYRALAGYSSHNHCMP